MGSSRWTVSPQHCQSCETYHLHQQALTLQKEERQGKQRIQWRTAGTGDDLARHQNMTITRVTPLLGLICFCYYYVPTSFQDTGVHKRQINTEFYHQGKFGDKTGKKGQGEKRGPDPNTVPVLTWFSFFQRLRTGDSSLDQISLSNLQPAVTDLPKILNCEIT